jgi:hypothetical protein
MLTPDMHKRLAEYVGRLSNSGLVQLFQIVKLEVDKRVSETIHPSEHPGTNDGKDCGPGREG